MTTTHLPATNGTHYVLSGSRAHDGTARFTLVHDGTAMGDGTDVILDAVTWNVIYRKVGAILSGTGYPSSIEDTLRSVLP
jgi:hypothetical protein